MKNMPIVCVIALLLIAVSGCTRLKSAMIASKSSTQITDEQMEALLGALETQDTESILTLFAPNALNEANNMETTVDLLYSYYQGNYRTYDNWDAANSETTKENDYLRVEYYGTYDVVTDMDAYRFAFHYVAADSADEGNVGINSIYVIKMVDDTDPRYAYRGDGRYTPGIQIGVPNSIPNEIGSSETE